MLPGKKLLTKLLLFKKNKKHQGLSIIEVVFALAIISITVFMIIGIFPYGLQEEQQAENTTIATNLAQSKIENLINSSYDELNIGTTTETTLTTIDQSFQKYSRITAIDYIDDNLQIVAQDLDFKKIKVMVSWYNYKKQATSTVILSTFIHKR